MILSEVMLLELLHAFIQNRQIDPSHLASYQDIIKINYTGTAFLVFICVNLFLFIFYPYPPHGMDVCSYTSR